MDSERYQLDAKAELAAGTALMRGPMLQTVLEDRFKLKIVGNSGVKRMYTCLSGPRAARN
jgi:uncharacterized protein (TIGR03435 family)